VNRGSESFSRLDLGDQPPGSGRLLGKPVREVSDGFPAEGLARGRFGRSGPVCSGLPTCGRSVLVFRPCFAERGDAVRFALLVPGCGDRECEHSPRSIAGVLGVAQSRRLSRGEADGAVSKCGIGRND
jgi:hypothetical protein